MTAPRRRFQFPWRSRDDIQSDFDEEISFHADMRIAELVARGETPEHARAIVRAEAGDIDDARRYVAAVDAASEAHQRRRMAATEFVQDVRLVARRLARAPIASAISVVTLAFGIGACVLMGTVAIGVLLKPLPFDQPDRVVMTWGYLPQLGAGFEIEPISGRYLKLIRDDTRAFSSVAGFRSRALNLDGSGAPRRLDAIEATGDFFGAIGAHAEIGRLFVRSDEPPAAERVVVLSDALWRDTFGADSTVLGRTIDLDGEGHTVIGVAARGFTFPRGAEMPPNFQFAPRPDAWIPIAPPSRGPSDLALVARLRPGVTIDAARADMGRMQAAQELLVPQTKGWLGTATVPIQTQLVGRAEPTLYTLLAAVLLVLMIACGNVAQLQLAQIQSRRRDMALRAALGASRGRLAIDLSIEMGLLTAAAGVLGTALAWAGLGYVRAAGSAHFPRLSEVTFGAASWWLASAATLAAGLAASIVPAIMGARLPLMETLRAGGRTHGTTPERRRRTLIVAELTISVVLVMSAGLLVRSLARQLGSATGFDVPHGLTFEVTLPPSAYPERQLATSMEHPKGVAYIAAALEAIQSIAGVDAVAIGKPLPLSGAEEATSFAAEGFVRAPHAPPPVAQYTIASPGMLRALGTPLLSGREFTADDREDAPPVVIVNRTMARALWPGDDAIGKRIKLGSLQSPSPWMTVVGVAADIKRYSLTESPRPEMIVPYTQKPYPSYATMQFIVRSAVPPDALVPRVREALGGVDRSVPMSRVRTLDELMGETSANARFATGFMGVFGIGALFLALVGLYSVVAFSVHQRRREFGVRRALGATGHAIVTLVMRDALRLTALGIVLGAAASLAAGRLLRHALYEVSAFDVATVAATVGVLALGTLAACVTPAWRAARVDPRVAMEDGG